MKGRLWIGTSGWSYDHWTGPFYPPGLPPEDRLPFYVRRFRSVEINTTFYHLPDARVVRAWRAAVPPGFVFACKASRYVTHLKKLREPVRSTRRFFRMVDGLGDRLGPLLFQLPPRWRVDVERLAGFLRRMPSGYRCAFEFRDESWLEPRILDLLAAHNAACCAFDLDRRRSPIHLTADFAYVRLHGPDGPYRGTYDGRALRGWARRFAAWRRAGRDVYCYFDNDEAGYAPRDASRLLTMTGRTS